MKWISIILVGLSVQSQALELQREGDRVCTRGAESRCYTVIHAMNPGLASDVEHLIPHLRFFNEWSRRSPYKLPTEIDALTQIGGAILVEPWVAALASEQLVILDIHDLAINIDPPHPLSRIPFVGTVRWKNRSSREGALVIKGHIRMVEGIFAMHMQHLPEFTQKFVANVVIEDVSGTPVPLYGGNGQGWWSTEDTVKIVLAPFLAGKMASLARIGFDTMKDRVQERLQNEAEKIVESLGPEKPL